MSVLSGGNDALMQLLARRKVEEQQDMLRALQVADKQKGWKAEQDRIRQADDQIKQVTENQRLLRQEADRRQAEVERQHEAERAQNIAENMMPGDEADPESAALLEKHGLGTGIIRRLPGLSMDMQRTPQEPAAPGDIPLLPQANRGVLKVTPDKVSSLGGTKWQQARQAADEKAEAARAAQQARDDAREDQQRFLEGQGDLNRRNARDLREITNAGRNSGRNDAGLTAPQEVSVITRLQNQWDSNTKGVREMDRMYSGMGSAFQNYDKDPNGVSQIVINAFNKVIDPNSVVREAEYDRSQAGLALKQRFEGWVQQYTKGGAPIPKAELAKMIETARIFRDGTRTATGQLKNRSTAMATKYGIAPDLIFGQDSSAGAAAPSAGASAGVVEWGQDANGNPVPIKR